MKLLAVLFCSFLSLVISAQSSFKKNSLYLEAGGNGLFGSLSFERQLTNKPGIGLRAGVGFYSENAFYLTLPVGLNYLFRLNDKQSFIDAGFGITWSKADGKIFTNSKITTTSDFVNFIPSIGYRKQTKANFMWRASISPVINKYTFFPWAGISVGKCF